MKKMLLIGLVLFGVYFFWCYAHMEAYCFFYPCIDTRYAHGFSEKAFSQITTGMTSEFVQQMLGAPLRIHHHAGGDIWSYTLDAKCMWGDWAWLCRQVNIRDGRVDEVINEVRYD